MTDLRKAAQQALEALEIASRNGSDGLKRYELKELDDTIAELRAALAQPEQEPVAWWDGKESVVFAHGEIYTPNWTDYWTQPLYTHPSQRKPLTEEEIDAIVRRNVTITDQNLAGAVYMSMRELEAAHGIGEQA